MVFYFHVPDLLCWRFAMGHGMPKSHFDSTTQGHVEKQTYNCLSVTFICYKPYDTSIYKFINTNKLNLTISHGIFWNSFFQTTQVECRTIQGGGIPMGP